MTYGEHDHPHMRYINPSIALHKGSLKISIRSSNFGVVRHGKWYFRDGNAYSKTDVLYGDFDPETLSVSNIVKLKFSEDTPTRIKVAGIEDVRLFSRADGIHAVGFESDRLSRSLHNKSASLAEFLIEGDTLIYLCTLEKPNPELVEKNWCPTDVAVNEFDFSYSATQSWRDGKLVGEPTLSQIHGGTQLIRQKDGTFLSVVHEKKLDPAFAYMRHNGVYDKYIYYTHLARHDKHGKIIQLTKPFRFGTHERIEFASGMVEHKDSLLISLGIHDCKYAIARIDKSRLVDLLEDIRS